MSTGTWQCFKCGEVCDEETLCSCISADKDKTEAREFWIGISKTGPMALSAVLTKEPDANDSRWDEVHHVIEATKLREWKDAYRAMCSKHDVLAARVQKLEAALERCHQDLVLKEKGTDHMYCTCSSCEKERSECEYCQILKGESES